MQLAPELASEIIRLGWQPIAGTDPFSDGINDGPHPKYHLICIRRVQNSRGSTDETRAHLEVASYGHDSVKSRWHRVDIKKPKWRHSLHRWFGARVMELLPVHEKIRTEKEAKRRRHLAEVEAIKKIHPCSDGVANAFIVRSIIAFKEDHATGDLTLYSFTTHINHMSFIFRGDDAIKAAAMCIQVYSIAEKDEPHRFD